MDLGLKDKVVFVAGSSRGIGLAIAAAFLKEGARCVLTGRKGDALASAAEALAKQYGTQNVLSIAGDMAQPERIQTTLRQTLKHWGRLDGVVVNIGSGKSMPGYAISVAEWNQAFENNFWPATRIATEALPLLKESGKGSLLFIASIVAGEATSAPLAYSAAKAALVNYAGNLARLVAKDHIRVNCVSPGNILFPGGSWEKHLENRREEVLDYLRAEVPQNRFGTPEEIADIAVFLASERASFVTGVVWVADGGQTRAF